MMNEYPMDEVYVFPTSYAQRRLWFLDQLEPGSPLYNVYDLVPLCGALDAAVLSRALNEVVARHEALRTTISLVDGEPVQVVAGNLQIPVQSVDLRGLSDSGRSAEIERLTYAEYERHRPETGTPSAGRFAIAAGGRKPLARRHAPHRQRWLVPGDLQTRTPESV